MTKTFTAQFEIGSVVATPGALEAIEEAEQEPRDFIARHITGDWGDLCEDDWRANNFSVSRRLRLLSAYHTKRGVKLWIITEADRSATTILLPEEY